MEIRKFIKPILKYGRKRIKKSNLNQILRNQIKKIKTKMKKMKVIILIQILIDKKNWDMK
jgi:tRNA U38,U39,U40 pseudouridine synthase TruA